LASPTHNFVNRDSEVGPRTTTNGRISREFDFGGIGSPGERHQKAHMVSNDEIYTEHVSNTRTSHVNQLDIKSSVQNFNEAASIHDIVSDFEDCFARNKKKLNMCDLITLENDITA